MYTIVMIVDTMKVLQCCFSKRVNGCQGDSFLSMDTLMGAIIMSQWLVLRIGGANSLHCWVTNSIWLERAESFITKQ